MFCLFFVFVLFFAKKKNYLDIREESFQHIGAGVAGVEEHELGLLQMARGETLLDVHI